MSRIVDSMKTNMKTYQIFGLLVFLLFVSLNTVSATHIVGGDMTYRCLGNDQYEITLTIRRDCEFGDPAAQFDDPASIGVFSSQGNLLTNIGNLGQLLIPFNMDDTLNTVLNTNCTILGNDVCVHETSYVTTVTLPYRFGGYVLAYQRCCRNGSLNNIVNPLEAGSTYYIELNAEAQTECNNSPVFNEWGDIYICANEELSFDHSATDADGDSLVYSLCIPKDGASFDDPKPQPPAGPNYSEITWAAGYDISNMMGGAPLEIDPATGVLTATPNVIGQYLIGICVEEYRNGVLLSKVTRDFEYNVRACGDGPVSSFEVQESTCPETELAINNTSTESDEYLWNFNHPSSDPFFQSTDEIPVFSYADEGDYLIELIVKKANTLCYDTSYQNISIVESTLDPSFTFSISDCNLEGVINMDLIGSAQNEDPNDPIESWEWTIVQGSELNSVSGQNPSLLIDSNYDLEVTLLVTTSSGCSKEYSRIIEKEDYQFSIQFVAELVECSEEAHQVQLTNTNNSSAAITVIEWTVNESGSNTVYTIENPLISVSSTNFEVSLYIEYDNGCSGEETKTISFSEDIPTALFIGSLTSCNGSTYQTENLSEGASSYFWNFNYPNSDPSFNSTLENPSFTYDAEGDYTIMLIASSSNEACNDTLFREISIVISDLDVDFDVLVKDCNGNGEDEIRLVSTASNSNLSDPIVSWEWNIIQGANSNSAIGETVDVNYVLNSEGSISLTVITASGCEKELTKNFMADEIEFEVDFDATFVECISDGYSILLTNSSNMLAAVTTLNWTVVENGVTTNYMGDNVVVDLSSPNVEVSINVQYDNGCEGEKSSIYDFSDSLPLLDFEIVQSECDGDAYVLVLTENSMTFSNVTVWNWVIDDGNSTQNESGQSVEVNVVGSSVIVTLYAVFENNCVTSLSKNFEPMSTPVDFDVNWNYLECKDGAYVISLVDNEMGQNLVWEINDGVSTQSFTGNDIIVTVQSTNITVQLIKENDQACSFQNTENIDLGNLLPEVGFEMNGFACVGSPIMVTLTDTTVLNGNLITEWNWTVSDGINVNMYSGNSVEVEVETTELEVTLEVVYGTNCTASVTSTQTVETINPIVDFDFQLVSCQNENVILQVIDQSSNPGLNITSWTWTLTDSNGQSISFGNPSIINTSDDQFTVTLQVEYDNGCTADRTKPIDISNIIPETNFTAELLSCANGEYLIELTENNSSTIDATNWTWVLTDSNGETILNGNPIQFTTSDESFNVDLSTGFQNGCNAFVSEEVNAQDMLPELEYAALVVGCNSDGTIMVNLMDTTMHDPYVPVSWTWTVTNSDGVNEVLNGSDALFLVPESTISVDIQLDVVYENGCQNSILNSDYPIADMLPTAQFQHVLVSCPTDSTVTVLFTYDSDIPFTDVESVSWEFIIDGEVVKTEVTQNTTLTFDPDEIVTVNYEVWYNSGCHSFYTEDIMVTPAGIDFIENPITGCIGQMLPLVSNPNPNFTYTWSPDTNLDFGMPQDFSNPIVTITENTTYFVTVTDGICTYESSVDVIVQDELNIIVTGDTLICDDHIFLVAIGAGENADYNWSTDINFNNIIAVNDTLDIIGNAGTYFVQAVDNSLCPSEIEMVTVSDASVQIDYADPLALCPGDTVPYTVFNLDATQDLIFLWEDDPHIIGDLNSDEIMIGFPIDETDGFNLILNTSNDLGCSRVDTISIILGTPAPLSFDYTVETCGEYTICFTNTSLNPGLPVWDFGDPTTTDDESLLLNPCYTYPASGFYDVTLSSISSVCGSMPITVTIEVPEDLELSFAQDTIEICGPNQISITAMTNSNNPTITWCDEDGNPIGTGMDIEVDVVSDTSFVAKGVDQFGCSDTATVFVELFDFDIDFNAPSDVCLGEETTIELINNGSGDYSYNWGPEDCIVSGGDTPNPTVVLTESKDFVVTVTHIETGCMEEINIPINAVVLDVSLETNTFTTDIIIGEEISITVVDEPDNSSYNWSSGQDTETITVSPTETTTYSVTVTDENGCFDIEIITISVAVPKCDETDVYIPNAFTPNNDGVNDELKVRSNFVTSMELLIYDRWGEEIYRSNSPKGSWDGTYKGAELPADVYGYCLKAVCVDGQEYITRGNVSLMR